MWNNLRRLIQPIVKDTILPASNCLYQQFRTTYILKRKNEPMLHKRGSHPKRLKNRHYIYELERCTLSEPRKPIEVILKTYVAGLGNIGDKVTVKPIYGYNHLLLTGKAVYASPENIQQYQSFAKKDKIVFSSSTVQYTLAALSKKCLCISMNMENPWVLKPWHIRIAFRKCGHDVPEDSITMPTKEIKGPNMNLQNKEFYITVTINKTELVQVRCRINHWSTAAVDKLPYNLNFYLKRAEPIFAEDKEILDSLPYNFQEEEIEQ